MCSSFWNADTNWFDWFSLFISALSILAAWFISYKIYSREKFDKEKDENDLLNQEVLFFNKNIKNILPAINHQIEVFEKFPITNKFDRTISIDTSFMSYFDLKNFYVKISNKENKEEKLDILNNLLIDLGSLNNYYEKEKTVFLALQKYMNLFPKMNVERDKALKKSKLYINSGDDYSEEEKNQVIEYLKLISEFRSFDYRELNNNCDQLTMKSNESSVVFEIDDAYRMVRNDFINSQEDFSNEFDILKSNLKDAKESIEKYLN